MLNIHLLTLLIGVSVASTPYKDCGSKKEYAEVIELEMEGGKLYLNKYAVFKGDTVSVTFKFITTENVTNPEITAVAKAVGITEAIPPMPGHSPHPCSDEKDESQMSCPIIAHEPNQYHISLPLVGEQVRVIQLAVDWIMKDDDGNIMLCLEEVIQVLPERH